MRDSVRLSANVSTSKTYSELFELTVMIVQDLALIVAALEYTWTTRGPDLAVRSQNGGSASIEQVGVVLVQEWSIHRLRASNADFVPRNLRQ